MTHIYIGENKNGKKEIYCKGHSGYAAAGADIVCSAISFLTYGFNRLVIEFDKRNKLQLSQMKISDGELHTVIYDPLNETASAFWMIRTALEELEENYPKNVKIYLEWEDFLKVNM